MNLKYLTQKIDLRTVIYFLCVLQILMCVERFSQSIFEISYVLAFVLILYCDGYKWILPSSRIPKIFFFLLVIFFLGCFSLLFSEGVLEGLDRYRSVPLKTAIIFFNISYMLRTSRGRKFFTGGVILTLAVMNGFGWMNYLGFEVYSDWQPATGSYSFPEAFQSFGIHKNEFAYALTFFLLVGIGLVLNEIQQNGFESLLRYRNLGLLILIVFGTVGLSLSMSRASILSFVGGVILLLFLVSLLDGRTKTILVFCIIAGVFIATLGVILYSPYGQITLHRFEQIEMNSKLMRSRTHRLYPVLLRMIHNNSSLHGVGFSAYDREFLKAQKQMKDYARQSDWVEPLPGSIRMPHNTYLDLWVRLGLVPMLFFLIMGIFSGLVALIGAVKKIIDPFYLVGFLVFVSVLHVNGLTVEFEKYLFAVAMAMLYMGLKMSFDPFDQEVLA